MDVLQNAKLINEFYEKTKNQTYEERGNYFKEDKEIKEQHMKGVEQDKELEVQDTVDTHFVAFIHKSNYLS